MVEVAGFNLMAIEEDADWSCRNSLGHMGDAMGWEGVEALVSVGFIEGGGFRSDLDSVVEEKVRKNTNAVAGRMLIETRTTSLLRF